MRANIIYGTFGVYDFNVPVVHIVLCYVLCILVLRFMQYERCIK